MPGNNCASCGQWAGKGHKCPSPVSERSHAFVAPASEPFDGMGMHVEDRVARAQRALTRPAQLSAPKVVGPPKSPPKLKRDTPEFVEFEHTFLNGSVMTEGKAHAMAARLHDGQTDQLGVAYIDHPESVLSRLQTSPHYAALSPEDKRACRIAALLHDTLEDTALKEEDLKRAGCSDKEITIIVAVTARKGEPKPAYYRRIIEEGGAPAVALKVSDMDDNNAPPRREFLPGSPSNPVSEGEEDKYTRLGKKYWLGYTALGAEVPSHLEQFAPEVAR